MKPRRISRWCCVVAGCGWFGLAGCSTVPSHQDPWFGQDKFLHFGGSAVISGAATAIGQRNGLKDRETFLSAMGLTVAVGLGKETYDARVKKTFWSWRDLTWGALGGLAGYGLVQLAD